MFYCYVSLQENLVSSHLFWALITFRNLRSAIGSLIRLIRNPFRGAIVSWWKFCSRVTIIIPASKNTKASVSLQQCTCADFFSVRRVRRRSCTTPTGHDIAPCFPLPFQHWAGESFFQNAAPGSFWAQLWNKKPLQEYRPKISLARCSRKLLAASTTAHKPCRARPKKSGLGVGRFLARCFRKLSALRLQHGSTLPV